LTTRQIGKERRDIVRMEPKTKFVIFRKTHPHKTLSTTDEELERRRRRKREPKKKVGRSQGRR
jgi:hypothetical protein